MASIYKEIIIYNK